MSQLQYVGARYVPKWYVNSIDQTANWEINVEYEPLTWVTTPNNHLYLSKKTVPDNVGTPAQNTEYWLDMGVFNSGGDQRIQEQIDAIVANIGSMSSLETADTSSLVAAINELFETKEEKSAGRKYLFIGDSYGDPTIVSPNWVNFTVQQLGLTTSQYYNACKTATGFIAGTTHFINQLDDYTGNKTEITDIVVCGGLNDSLFTSTADQYFSDTVNAIEAFANKARTDYPNATLWLGYNGNAIDNSPSIPAGTRKWLQRQWCIYVYSQYGARNGFKLIPNVDKALCLNIALYGNDHVHPNGDGSRIIATAVTQALMGGSYVPFMTKSNVGFRVRSGRSKTGQEDFSYYIDGDTCHIKYQGTIIVTAPDIASVTSGNWYEYGTMSQIYFNEPVIIPVEIVLNTSSGLTSYQGQAKFDGSTVYFAVKEFDRSTHTYYNVTMATTTSARQVIMTDLDFDVPTLYIN